MRIACLAAVVLACSPMALAQKAGGGAGGAGGAGGMSPAQATDGAIDLRPKLETGKSFHFTMQQTSTTRSGLASKGGGRQPKTGKPDAGASTSAITMGLVMRVAKGGGDGDSEVEFTIDELKVSTKGGDIEIDYDSAKPAKDDDLVALAMKSIVGWSFTAIIDRAGNIKSVGGGEGLASIGQLGGGGGIGAGLGGLGGGPGGGFLGPIVNTGAGSGFARVGQSWENKDSIGGGMLGAFQMITRHTLTSMRGKDAIIDLKGHIDAASEAPGGAGGGGGAQVRDTSYTGQYQWDTGEGMLKKMDSTMRATLETQGEQGRETTTSEVKTTITRGSAGRAPMRGTSPGGTSPRTTPPRR